MSYDKMEQLDALNASNDRLNLLAMTLDTITNSLETHAPSGVKESARGIFNLIIDQLTTLKGMLDEELDTQSGIINLNGKKAIKGGENAKQLPSY